MARPMHTPESATAAAIARRWAAPWKATCELLIATLHVKWEDIAGELTNAQRVNIYRGMREDELRKMQHKHTSAYYECLSAGIPPRVIARRDLDDPRLSDSARRQAIVNAVGAGPCRRRTISTFPHNDPQGDK